MEHTLTPEKIAGSFRSALDQGLVRTEDTALIFYDFEFLNNRIRYLQSCFPAETMHCLAIKSCPLSRIMKLTRDQGCGVEAASLGEVMLALRNGFPASRVVYDSPVKTVAELEFALGKGVCLNMDNLTEIKRIKDILHDRSPKGRIGIRINPQVGVGTIMESSVAGEYSKFGVPIRYRMEELVNAFRENDWLTGVHLHVGSQGCPTEMLVEGVGILYDFMQDINLITRKEKGYNQITTFDIGGGLPISYCSSKQPLQMEEYVAKLKDRAPALFPAMTLISRAHEQTEMHLITEFGRWTYTNAGWTASRVEYVKHDPRVNTAMIHVGADLFVRECLNPDDWPHEYLVLDPAGNIRGNRSEKPWNLAGPLCFSGDILAKGLILPDLQEGDYLIIRDTGGYTFSMWSRYNSRFAPRILGYQGETFSILKERETIEEVERFWE